MDRDGVNKIMIIGIDPGITGALFFQWNNLDGDIEQETHDIPIMAKSSGKGSHIETKLEKILLLLGPQNVGV